MNIPDQLPPLTKRFEGLARVDAATGLVHVYNDATGLPTIGWGHRCNADQKPITETEAEYLLHNDLQSACDTVAELCPTIVGNPAKVAALADFVFNLGAERFKNSHLCYFVQQGKYDLAAQQFGKWVHAGNAVLPGLVERREAERLLFIGA